MARVVSGWLSRTALVVAGVVGAVALASPVIDYFTRPPLSGPSGVNTSDTTLTHRVTVTFDSITVHNNHDGFFSGDGEYWLAAYVQGVKINLTDASDSGLCAGWGCPNYLLFDVEEGQTIAFKPGAQVTVSLPKNVPLSVFTVGVEVDGCGRRRLPDANEIKLEQFELTLAEVFQNLQLRQVWGGAVNSFRDAALGRQGCITWLNAVVPPTLNGNDVLGAINKFYEPLQWGAGTHQELSSIKDYTLRYTISVASPPNVVVQ